MQRDIDVQIAVRDFEGQPLTTYIIDGAELWRSSDVAKLLGYNSGRKIASNISGPWAEEFIDGTDYRVIAGEPLDAIKATCAPNGDEWARVPSALFLTEQGVNLVCMKTRKPKGVDFRRWLAEDVIPSIRATGGYRAPTAPPWPDQPGLEVDGLADTHAELAAEAIGVLTPERGMDLAARAIEMMPDARPLLREQWVTAALAHAGLPVIMPVEPLAPAEPEPVRRQAVAVDRGPAQPELPYTPKAWLSPTDIAELESTTPQMVGRIITQLDLRDPSRPDVDVQEVEAPNGRVVDSYRYTGEALAAIRAEVRGR